MKRQLKFRVYNPDQDRTIHFDLCDFEYLHQDKYPVQQFIGFIDGCGNEIYEGDILKLKNGEKVVVLYGDYEVKDANENQPLLCTPEIRRIGVYFEDALGNAMEATLEDLCGSSLCGNIPTSPALSVSLLKEMLK